EVLRPGAAVQVVLLTCAQAFARTRPKVKVMPPVTGYATKGGVSRRCAQLLLGSGSPRVARPSRAVGSKRPSVTAVLYASSVRRQAARSRESLSTRASSVSAMAGMPVL